jgi:hypothetical protein
MEMNCSCGGRVKLVENHEDGEEDGEYSKSLTFICTKCGKRIEVGVKRGGG